MITARQTVLVVEPISDIRVMKGRILERNGYEVIGVASVAAALAFLVGRSVALILLDLPEDRTAWTALDAIRSRDPAIPVIVAQQHARLEDAVEAMRRGAADYLPKSLDPVQLLRSVGEALRATSTPSPSVDLIERSPAMRALMGQVRRVAPSSSNVLLCGESGVGKEVVARYAHRVSPRATKDFVAINCASLSEEILENELFGHEPGAFTSANARKSGVFELADGGTLFFDEVGEMGLRCQAKVLRAIERQEFRRVGGTRKESADRPRRRTCCDAGCANLSQTDLSRADLRGANLRSAKLLGAKLCEAVLDGAKLSGALVRGADFSGVRGLTAEQMTALGREGAKI